MSTPPIPQTTVNQSGMLSRSPGAKNLPSRPMMMPAMITPMMSIATLSLLGRPGSTAFASTRPAEGSIQLGKHCMTEVRGPFAEHLKGPHQPAGHGKADPAGLIWAVGGHMAKQAGELRTRFRAGSPPSDEVR